MKFPMKAHRDNNEIAMKSPRDSNEIYMVMMALKLGAPEDYMQILQEYADAVNLPQIGTNENIAFLAIKANITLAVTWQDAIGI